MNPDTELVYDALLAALDALKTAHDHIHFVLARNSVRGDDLSDLQTAYDATRKALHDAEGWK